MKLVRKNDFNFVVKFAVDSVLLKVVKRLGQFSSYTSEGISLRELLTELANDIFDIFSSTYNSVEDAKLTLSDQLEVEAFRLINRNF